MAQQLSLSTLIQLQADAHTNEVTTEMVWRKPDLRKYDMDVFFGSLGPRNKPPWNAPPFPKNFVPLSWKLVTGLKSFKWALKTSTPATARSHPVILAFNSVSAPLWHRPQLTSILPAAWIIFNNPVLESIELDNFQCLDALPARIFIRAISGLQNLKRIRIFSRGYKIPETFVFALLKSLPLSMESIQLDFCTVPDNSGLFEEIAVQDDADFGLEPLVQRTERFPRLTELKLPRHSVKYTIDQVDTILQRCPALRRFVIPQTIREHSGHQLANFLHGRCENVHHWSIDQPLTPTLLPVDGQDLLETLSNIRPRRMKKLLWKSLHEGATFNNMVFHGSILPTLSRFTYTLTSLRFVDTIHIASASIQGILTTCSALTSFTIHHRFDWRSVLSLEDAIEGLWACTSIETLDIAIGVEPTAGLQPGYQQWNMWGSFVRQIGGLKELKSLRLMALPPMGGNGLGSRMYDRCSLPGFLTLNDGIRRGFLSYLWDLTKLQDLQGSFHLNKHTLSDAEVNWIKKHWQKFRMLELYPTGHFSTSRGVDLPAPVKRLRNEFGVRIDAYPEEEEQVWC
ncbi:hypothetical protein BGZ97_000470 [Linnemannia gamsii]|uniref:F-box domain-containing protein n=1 Tax=Linnemannia gamsii TaxID=64522 RepID=A0A9P6QY60_9FUNG|nr:hypothetical protein BGZ97_000470 [Linnemannia gamsii]